MTYRPIGIVPLRNYGAASYRATRVLHRVKSEGGKARSCLLRRPSFCYTSAIKERRFLRSLARVSCSLRRGIVSYAPAAATPTKHQRRDHDPQSRVISFG